MLSRRTPMKPRKRSGPNVEREPKPWAPPTVKPLRAGSQESFVSHWNAHRAASREMAAWAKVVTVDGPEPIRRGRRMQ